MRVRESLKLAAARLEAVGDTPRLDAELLMAHALGVSREEMLLNRLDAPVPDWEALIERRLAHEPVAYIIGRRAFWTIELEVGPGVLIPRPDSETLIEAALAHFGEAGPMTILDLGTGPGTLLLAALSQWPDARGIGIDSSEQALELARRNAARLGLEGRTRFRIDDWAANTHGRWDLVLCNPPYVAFGSRLPPEVAGYEPAAALFADPDGLDAYRALAPCFWRLLAPGGIVCLEIGAGQEEAVSALTAAEGFIIESRRDLGGIVRCLVLRPDRD